METNTWYKFPKDANLIEIDQNEVNLTGIHRSARLIVNSEFGLKFGHYYHHLHGWSIEGVNSSSVLKVTDFMLIKPPENDKYVY